MSVLVNNSESFLNSLINSCGDCSFPQVDWISINKGVYLCDECCSIHRSLGRHLSYVRSIKQQRWPDGLLQMCLSLLQKNSNSIWEHDLYYVKNSSQQQKFNTLSRNPHLHNNLSVQNRPKKPQPQDPQTPVKEAYIKCKYQDLAYTQKLNSSKDSPTATVEDFSQQLHASARTNNLETCLRLLALGAQPSYIHPHRGSSPLHVAGQAGQIEQCELLFVYGADPCSLDKLGHTPEECARIAGFHILADRLLEMQYECSDRLSFYLNDILPDHKSGEHFLVPDVFKCDEDELMRSPRQKLRTLNNEAFEDLCQDVFDEVDRRETEKAWLLRSRGSGIPFLPNNRELNHLRNQSRQKLGLLSEEEFRRFVSDILLDAKRRQDLSIDLGPNSQSGGTLIPISDSYNPLIPQTNNEYDVVPEDFRQMLKGSDSTNDDRESSMETTPLPDGIESADPVFSISNNEQHQRLEGCYQLCQSQLSAMENSVSQLQENVKRVEAKLDQLIQSGPRQHTSSPALVSPPVPAHSNRITIKNPSAVISIVSKQTNPQHRHTIMDSSSSQRKEPIVPPKTVISCANLFAKPKADAQPDEQVMMKLISRLVEQISMLMDSIRSNECDQVVTRVNSIIALSQDMLHIFPPNYESPIISPLVEKLRNSTSLLSSSPLVGSADMPIDTNQLISLVIDVSNSAKKMVAALTDKSPTGRIVSSV